MKLPKPEEIIRAVALPVLSLTSALGIFISIISRDFPKVGHDYDIHIPRMLDTYLFYRSNGLAIQWYTPSFGGGIPAYPNPQNIQFSLPQLLMFVINPWWALMMGLVIYSIIGFLSFYFFLRNEMELTNEASSLGAVFILANGFYIEHAIVGHITFQQFPLLGLIIFLAFSKKLHSITSGVLLGLAGALLIHQGGFYLGVIFLLSLVITLPLIYLFRPQVFIWKRLIVTFSIGALLAMLISASKLNAVVSFMRFFPRLIDDAYGKTYIQGFIGMAFQLLGSFVIIPYYLLTGKNLDEIPRFFKDTTGASDYGIWETDISVSPSIILILVAGVINLASLARDGHIRFSKEKWIASLILILGIWLATDFSLAQGWLYHTAKTLPVLTSLHVNVRFASAFIFPLSFLSASIFDTLYKETSSRAPFLFLNSLAILAILVYLPLDASLHRRNFKIEPSLFIYSQIEQGDDFSVRNISNVSDHEVFIHRSSNLYKMDEAIFGYGLEYFKPELHPGPVFEINGGYYNMTNPASYVFPAENNLHPFERFHADQLTELEQFVNRKQLNFKMSVSQNVSNILSLVSLTGLLLYVLVRIVKAVSTATSFHKAN